MNNFTFTLYITLLAPLLFPKEGIRCYTFNAQAASRPHALETLLLPLSYNLHQPYQLE
jgi:hypothetical protein